MAFCQRSKIVKFGWILMFEMSKISEKSFKKVLLNQILNLRSIRGCFRIEAGLEAFTVSQLYTELSACLKAKQSSYSIDSAS